MSSLRIFLLVSCCWLLPQLSSGQTTLLGKNLQALQQEVDIKPSSVPSATRLLWLISSPDFQHQSAILSLQPALATAPIPPAWRYQELAPFCKLEVQMEKAFKLPIKFRLGEVQQVERKEGKLKTTIQ